MRPSPSASALELPPLLATGCGNRFSKAVEFALAAQLNVLRVSANPGSRAGAGAPRLASQPLVVGVAMVFAGSP
jgi:hypothetical protein